jgi:hypothetical protein
VRDVFVDGRPVVRDRAVLTVDEAALLREARAVARRAHPPEAFTTRFVPR